MAANSSQQLTELLQQRKLLAAQLETMDKTLVNLIQDNLRSAYTPVSQEQVQHLVAIHSGNLSVKAICLISGLSPTTYYNIMTKLDTVKIGTLQAMLNTIGLELYIGQKETGQGNVRS